MTQNQDKPPGTRRRLFAGIGGGFAMGLSALPVRSQTAPPQPIAAGATISTIDTYDRPRLDRITGPELDEFMASSTMPTAFRGRFAPARYAVTLHQVTYRSVVPERGNSPTTASGLIAIPETGSWRMPMVSYQHGTVFNASEVPSNPKDSAETRLMLAQFAAQGYVVISADYFGRGLSDLPDSYLVRDSTRQATFDMLTTARDVLASRGIEPSHLFLSGWSQGGWATIQFLHKLQSVGMPPAATAIASAPVDIYLTMNRWLSNPQPVDAVYLPGVVALQLQAQEHYHRQPGLAASAIRPAYLEPARALFEGRLGWASFLQQTTPKLPDFIRPEFAAAGFIGEAPYWRTLEAAQAYRWRSTTPLRVYHGGKDEVTPEAIGKLPEATQRLLGGAPVQTVDAGPEADHRAVFVAGMLDQKPWFDALAAR